MVLFTKKVVPQVEGRTDIGEVAITPSFNKRVTITFVDKNKPDFNFEGTWSGRDIMVAAKTIVRAYRILQLSQRRSLANAVSQETTQPI